MQLNDSGVDCRNLDEMKQVLQHVTLRETILQKLNQLSEYKSEQGYLMQYITLLLKTLK